MSTNPVNPNSRNNYQNFTDQTSEIQITEVISNNELKKTKWFSQIDKTQEITESMWAVSMLIEDGENTLTKLVNHHTF